MSRSSVFHRLGGFALAFALLGGCTVLPKSEPLQVYQFPYPPSPNVQQAPNSLDLRINTPSSGFSLSGPRILVNKGQQLLSYKGARWSDPVPTLLREYLTVAFDRHGGLSSVSTDIHSLHADVHLGTDLRRFELELEPQPRVVIELDARLINPASRRIQGMRTFSVEYPVTDTQMETVVNGFGAATDQLASELIPWVLNEMSLVATGE